MSLIVIENNIALSNSVVSVFDLGIVFFFFNDTATTEIYTLSLHDALPIFTPRCLRRSPRGFHRSRRGPRRSRGDRKSTRLNSSHLVISYAVFCLKKKINTYVFSRNEALPTPSSRVSFLTQSFRRLLRFIAS